MNPAKNHTGKPIFIHISHHVSIDDDPPLVNGAIATLIDMREVRIMKDASVVRGGLKSALWFWPGPRNRCAFDMVVLRLMMSWSVHGVRGLPPMRFGFYCVDYGMMVSVDKLLTSLLHPNMF